MDFLKNFIPIFEQHKISQYSELTYQIFNKSEKHPSSEGIKFESLNFAGEIFYYANKDMEYCEMEILIFKGEKHKFRIIEKPNLIELKKKVPEFLTEIINELKNVA